MRQDGRVEWDGCGGWTHIERLVAELPSGSAVGVFERACSLDSTGHSDLAVPVYREALDLGLTGERRRRAVIQLASSLRNVGRSPESVDLLKTEMVAEAGQLDDAVRAFLALTLVDTGCEREAVSLAVGALAPHLPRYQRSVANYASLLMGTGPESTVDADEPAGRPRQPVRAAEESPGSTGRGGG